MFDLWLDVVAFPTFPRLPEKTLRLLIVIVLVGCRYLRIAIRHDMMYRNDPDSFKLSGIHAVYRLSAALRCNLYAVAAIRECIAIRRIAMICRRAVGTIVRGDIGGGGLTLYPHREGGGHACFMVGCRRLHRESVKTSGIPRGSSTWPYIVSFLFGYAICALRNDMMRHVVREKRSIISGISERLSFTL
jgi:hypothetical protein